MSRYVTLGLPWDKKTAAPIFNPSVSFTRRFKRSTFAGQMIYPKHEIIRCERCSTSFECKANSFVKCQCSTVQLSINEVQYVSELYDGCLCASCLLVLQKEYQESL